jgi:hypothetical protein
MDSLKNSTDLERKMNTNAPQTIFYTIKGNSFYKASIALIPKLGIDTSKNKVTG